MTDVCDVSHKYVLSEDVVSVATADLDVAVRTQINCGDEEVLISSFSGTPSYVFDLQARVLIESFAVPTSVDDAIQAYARASGAEPETACEEAMPLIEQLRSSSLLVPAGLDASRPSAFPQLESLTDMRTVFLHRTLTRLADGSTLYREGLETAPTCSVNFGAAGIAYFLYRQFLVLDDRRLLDDAECWLNRAYRDASSSSAFRSQELEISGTPISLYHGALGLDCVAVLIAAAKGDTAAVRCGVERFVESSAACSPESNEVARGRAGALIGCAIVLEKSGSASELVVERGNQLFDAITRAIRENPVLSLHATTPCLGAAHGWAGILYSLLRWCGSSGRPVPGEVTDAVLQLAGFAQADGQGARWPMRFTSPDTFAGWCHGSAGYIPLWILADRLIGHSLLDLAVRAGWHIWNTRTMNASLCCGLAGHAYALASLFRATHAPEWLARAEATSRLAASCALLPALPGQTYRRDGLAKGSVGVALLCGEMLRPDLASFPLYELP